MISNVRTMDEIVAATESSRRFNTAILSVFAGIALVLALLGVYGVLAYGVTQQTREIAIRMALGASRGVVLLRTLRYALIVATAGVASGLIVSIGLTRFLSSLLYGVKPLDWVTLAGTVLCCSAVVHWRLLACTARRIDRSDASLANGVGAKGSERTLPG